ncbi:MULTISPECIES: hypothetical protein [Streptomyces]|nr:hypothetical protein [Streptomyces sp. BK205]
MSLAPVALLPADRGAGGRADGVTEQGADVEQGPDVVLRARRGILAG